MVGVIGTLLVIDNAIVRHVVDCKDCLMVISPIGSIFLFKVGRRTCPWKLPTADILIGDKSYDSDAFLLPSHIPRFDDPALTLHVPQTLDDLSVPDAHDVDASHPVRFALAPAKLPADDPAVAHRGDFLSFEDKVGGRRHSLPESEASVTPFVACSIRSRRRIFENAALANQVVEVFGAVRLKGAIEAFHDFAGNFAISGHFRTSLNHVAAVDPERVADDERGSG
jgi:hypothetical protein